MRLLTTVFVLGLLACGGKAAPPPDETSGRSVNASAWTEYAGGPLTVRGGSVGDGFDGDANCYAIDGDACGTDMSVGSRARVLHCTPINGATPECVVETGGLVTAEQRVCCIAANGAGGALSVDVAP
jgi:hypothetical protein